MILPINLVLILLSCPAVKAEMADMWKDSVKMGIEEAFAIHAPCKVKMRSSGMEDEIYVSASPPALVLVHTHKKGGRPSKADILMAQAMKIPVVAITFCGLWIVYPNGVEKFLPNEDQSGCGTITIFGRGSR